MQAPLVRGRFFAEGDQDGKQRVAIIDETTAHRYWTDRDPLGRRLRFGPDPTQPWMTVVGVVKDIKNDGLDIDGVPHIFVSIYQNGSRDLSVVLRTSLPAAPLEPQIRSEIQRIDPGLPVFNVSSMNEVLDRSLAPRRFSAGLVGGFAGWRCFWPPSEFMACWPTWSAKGRAKSASEWHWEPAGATS